VHGPCVPSCAKGPVVSACTRGGVRAPCLACEPNLKPFVPPRHRMFTTPLCIPVSSLPCCSVAWVSLAPAGCAFFSPSSPLSLLAAVAHAGRTDGGRGTDSGCGVTPCHVSAVRDACMHNVFQWHPCPKPKLTSSHRKPSSSS
jgi:hypothetical protein